MIALHTFDMEKIREPTNYKEMVDASGGTSRESTWFASK
jgi:hypothetical protein